MGLLAATTPARLGVASSGAGVAASDTISTAVLGARGAILEVLNGNAAVDNMTISDAGATPAGTPGATYAASVANGTNKAFKIVPSQADPVTGLVTITHSVIGTVTYKLYPLG